MVGSEQSIKKGIGTFLSFSAKSVEPQILEQLLIGRSETADLLTRYAKQIVSNGQNHQIILVGPRGSGKTHMLRVLFHRINNLIENGDLVVAYFAEEEYGIDGYLDFLIRIINSFKRWYENDKPLLEEKLEAVRNASLNNQEKLAEDTITGYLQKKPLLILTENFDIILDSIGNDGQNKLRAFLYRNNRTSIIATSQALNPDLKKEDKPFYNFFILIFLKKLDHKDSLTLLQQLAEIEGIPELIEHFKKRGRTQLRAIHRLVKGNHRLLVTFFEFLKSDSLADLSTIFIKTMNDLKPYFETFIRYLPPQQQKIIHYLALSKTPKRGTEISKYCFINDKSISKVLSELQRKRLVEAISDPTSKRDKLYDIAEPLLRIAIEIGEQKQGITSLFIDFLALYYSEQELTEQKNKFEHLHINESDEIIKTKYIYEIQAREQAMLLKIKGTSIEGNYGIKMSNLVKEDKYNELIKLFKNTNLKTDSEYMYLAFSYLQIGDPKKAIQFYQKAIKLNSKNTKAIGGLGLSYEASGQLTKAVDLFNKVAKLDPQNWLAWFKVSSTYNQLNNFKKGLEAAKKAVKANPQSDGAWMYLGIQYSMIKQYDKEVESYKKSVLVNPKNIASWNLLGLRYTILNKRKEAFDAFVSLLPLNIEQAYEGIFNFLLVDIDLIQSIYKNNKEYMTSDKSYEVFTMVVTNALKQGLKKESVQYYLDIINNIFKAPEKLSIATSFLNVYKKIILEKNQNALYALPKEQRDFFEQEILKKKDAQE